MLQPIAASNTSRKGCAAVLAGSFTAAAACLIGMVLPVVVQLDHWYIVLGLGFGPVAGMIYWSVAGRRAGIRLPATT